MLKLENVSAGYGRFTVLHEVTSEIRTGDFRVIIGPNGAGKTTLLRTIFGLIRPNSGRIILDGRDIAGQDPRKLLDAGVAYVPQQPSIFPQLTVEDNLAMGLFRLKRPDPSLVSKTLDRFDLLARRRGTQAQALSGGERRLLELARALMTSPQLLMLDEPSLGLSPVMMERVLQELRRINAEGVTVVLVEQRVKVAAPAAKSIGVLRLGRFVQEGSGREANDPKWLAEAIYGSESTSQAAQ
jgi:ABC-type branched-subunit amino acid transport system ATPase component